MTSWWVLIPCFLIHVVIIRQWIKTTTLNTTCSDHDSSRRPIRSPDRWTNRRSDTVAFRVEVRADRHRVAGQLLVDVFDGCRLGEESVVSIRITNAFDPFFVVSNEHARFSRRHERPHPLVHRNWWRLKREYVSTNHKAPHKIYILCCVWLLVVAYSEESFGWTRIDTSVFNLGLFGEIFCRLDRWAHALHGQKRSQVCSVWRDDY